MHFGEIGGTLIGAREGAEFRILIEIAEESNADGVPGPPMLSSSPVSMAGGLGESFSRIPLGWMTAGWPVRLVMVSCSPSLGTTMMSTILKNGGHLLDGDGAGAIGLDVFDGGIEARGAKHVGPIFRTLGGEQLVAAGHGEIIKRGGSFGGQ